MRYQFNLKCLDCDKLEWIGYLRDIATGKVQAHADYNLHTATLVSIDMHTLTSTEEQFSPDLQFLF